MEFYTNAEKLNQPLEVAVILGAHPAWSLGALNIGSIDEEELYLMGALAGEAMEVVQAETMDLKVPARAEIILEGEILPFEEWTRGPSGSSRATRWAAESVKFFTSKRSLTEKTRCCMISRCSTGPSAVVDDPDGSQSLPLLEGHGPVGKGGANSGAVYRLRLD